MSAGSGVENEEIIGTTRLATRHRAGLNWGMQPPAPAPPTLALVRDLLFASKITVTAASIGTCVQLVRDPGKLGGYPGNRLIVDLNLAGAIEAAQVWKAATGGEVVGFVSHVDTATIDRARAAGVDRVLARSRFVERLPQLLSGETSALDQASG